MAKAARRGFRGYPIATIACYGPTNRFASKVVAGIVVAEGEAPVVLERWFSTTSDVRVDPEIGRQVVELVQAHDVRSVAAAPQLLGCPHEEGVDYPDGEVCPRCPFWATVDRFTHQPKA